MEWYCLIVGTGTIPHIFTWNILRFCKPIMGDGQTTNRRDTLARICVVNKITLPYFIHGYTSFMEISKCMHNDTLDEAKNELKTL